MHNIKMSFSDLPCAPEKHGCLQVGGTCYYMSVLTLFHYARPMLRSILPHSEDVFADVYAFAESLRVCAMPKLDREQVRTLCQQPPDGLKRSFALFDVETHQPDSALLLFDTRGPTFGYREKGGAQPANLLQWLLRLDPNRVAVSRVTTPPTQQAHWILELANSHYAVIDYTPLDTKAIGTDLLKTLQEWVLAESYVPGLHLMGALLITKRHVMTLTRCEDNKWVLYDSNYPTGQQIEHGKLAYNDTPSYGELVQITAWYATTAQRIPYVSPWDYLIQVNLPSITRRKRVLNALKEYGDPCALGTRDVYILKSGESRLAYRHKDSATYIDAAGRKRAVDPAKLTRVSPHFIIELMRNLDAYNADAANLKILVDTLTTFKNKGGMVITPRPDALDLMTNPDNDEVFKYMDCGKMFKVWWFSVIQLKMAVHQYNDSDDGRSYRRYALSYGATVAERAKMDFNLHRDLTADTYQPYLDYLNEYNLLTGKPLVIAIKSVDEAVMAVVDAFSRPLVPFAMPGDPRHLTNWEIVYEVLRRGGMRDGRLAPGAHDTLRTTSLWQLLLCEQAALDMNIVLRHRSNPYTTIDPTGVLAMACMRSKQNRFYSPGDPNGMAVHEFTHLDEMQKLVDEKRITPSHYEAFKQFKDDRDMTRQSAQHLNIDTDVNRYQFMVNTATRSTLEMFVLMMRGSHPGNVLYGTDGKPLTLYSLQKLAKQCIRRSWRLYAFL